MLYLFGLGFTSGFGSILGFLLEQYNALLRRLFWPIEPFITMLVTQLYHTFGWPETIYGQWRHIVVLLGLYFFREVWIGRHFGLDALMFNLVLAICVALTFGLLAGTIPLTHGDEMAQFLFVFVLIAGAAAYGIIGFVFEAMFVRQRWAEYRNKPVPTWCNYLRWGFSRVLIRSLVGLALAWVALQIPFVLQLPSPGVAVSIMLIMLFGMYWLWDGIVDSRSMALQGASRLSSYVRSTHTQLGLAILGPILWCFVFIVLRAINVL
jgi:hypothetical protein